MQPKQVSKSICYSKEDFISIRC